MKKLNELNLKMIEYYKNDPKRIQHFTKVYTYAKLIGEIEDIEKDTLEILTIAALVHDIGIKNAEIKYGNCNGKNQEKEGPNIARKLLTEIGYEEAIIERVCYLVGHHHTYTDIQGIDYQILVEADFIVNMYEDNESKEVCKKVYDKIFKTNGGKRVFALMFGIE